MDLEVAVGALRDEIPVRSHVGHDGAAFGRQLASPMRFQFSSPLSPSISVTHPGPDGRVAQPNAVVAAISSPIVMTHRRFIVIPPASMTLE